MQSKVRRMAKTVHIWGWTNLHNQRSRQRLRLRTWSMRVVGANPLLRGLVFALALAANRALCSEPSDPILDLLLQKGIVTEAEVQKARADAERIRTNQFVMPPVESKWKIGKAIKNIELF